MPHIDLSVNSDLLTRWCEQNSHGVVFVGVSLREPVQEWCRQYLPDRVFLDVEVQKGRHFLFESFSDVLGDFVPLCFENEEDMLLFVLRWGGK
jgi:hypothetical protein